MLPAIELASCKAFLLNNKHTSGPRERLFGARNDWLSAHAGPPAWSALAELAVPLRVTALGAKCRSVNP